MGKAYTVVPKFGLKIIAGNARPGQFFTVVNAIGEKELYRLPKNATPENDKLPVIKDGETVPLSLQGCKSFKVAGQEYNLFQ